MSFSRRSVVTTAAALPALTVPAVLAGADPADDKLVELADDAFKLSNALEAVPNDSFELTEEEKEIHDRLPDVLGRHQEHPSAVASRAHSEGPRVADMGYRSDGEMHSTGPHDAWMVVDDLLAIGGVAVFSFKAGDVLG